MVVCLKLRSGWQVIFHKSWGRTIRVARAAQTLRYRVTTKQRAITKDTNHTVTGRKGLGRGATGTRTGHVIYRLICSCVLAVICVCVCVCVCVCCIKCMLFCVCVCVRTVSGRFVSLRNHSGFPEVRLQKKKRVEKSQQREERSDEDTRIFKTRIYMAYNRLCNRAEVWGAEGGIQGVGEGRGRWGEPWMTRRHAGDRQTTGIREGERGRERSVHGRENEGGGRDRCFATKVACCCLKRTRMSESGERDRWGGGAR